MSALSSLAARLAPSAVRAASLKTDESVWGTGRAEGSATARSLDIENVLKAVGLRSAIFFTIVKQSPSSLHTPLQGGLPIEKDSLGIALHEILGTDPATKTVTVDMEPYTFRSSAAESYGPLGFALLLSPHTIPLSSLLQTRVWKATSDLHMSFDSDSSISESVRQNLLLDLLQAPCGLDVHSLPHHAAQTVQPVLDAWFERGLVESTTQDSTVLWKLSSEALQVLRTGWKLCENRPLFPAPEWPQSSDFSSFSLFLLFQSLDANGWSCTELESKKKRSKEQKKPYIQDESPKVFYVVQGQKASLAFQLYCRSLLEVARHEQQVPHLDSRASVYEVILGIKESKPSGARRRGRFSVGFDEWGNLDDIAPPRKPTRRRCKTKTATAAMDMEFHELRHTDDSQTSDSSDGKDGSPASASSTTTSSSSSSASASSAGSPTSTSSSATTQQDMPRSSLHAGQIAGSKKAKQRTEAPKTAAHTRRRNVQEQWVLRGDSHYLTPRHRNNQLISWQMTCANPLHHKCTKEISLKVSGTSLAARCLLKASALSSRKRKLYVDPEAWVLAGYNLPSRAEHMGEALRRELLDGLRKDLLWSEEEMDNAKDLTFDHILGPYKCSEAPVLPQPDGKDRPKRRKKEKSNDESLGPPAPGVPAEVHTRMLALFASGAIPCTTVDQRQRNAIVSSSQYTVPAPLKEALAFSYIGPNMPPPSGLCWRAHAGEWKLSVRGG
eukprot:6492749-Amphidinium_carterae.8